MCFGLFSELCKLDRQRQTDDTKNIQEIYRDYTDRDKTDRQRQSQIGRDRQRQTTQRIYKKYTNRYYTDRDKTDRQIQSQIGRNRQTTQINIQAETDRDSQRDGQTGTYS